MPRFLKFGRRQKANQQNDTADSQSYGDKTHPPRKQPQHRHHLNRRQEQKQKRYGDPLPVPSAGDDEGIWYRKPDTSRGGGGGVVKMSPNAEDWVDIHLDRPGPGGRQRRKLPDEFGRVVPDAPRSGPSAFARRSLPPDIDAAGVIVQNSNSHKKPPLDGGLVDMIQAHDWATANRIIRENPKSVRVKHKLVMKDPEQRNPQFTKGLLALHVAVCQKNVPVEFLQSLLEIYPDASQFPDESQRRLPIHWACLTGAPMGTIQTLLNHFPRSGQILDGQARLPLHYCARYGSPETVSLVLQAEKRAVAYRDEAGQTPLDFCLVRQDKQSDFSDILRALQHANTRIKLKRFMTGDSQSAGSLDEINEAKNSGKKSSEDMHQQDYCGSDAEQNAVRYEYLRPAMPRRGGASVDSSPSPTPVAVQRGSVSGAPVASQDMPQQHDYTASHDPVSSSGPLVVNRNNNAGAVVSTTTPSWHYYDQAPAPENFREQQRYVADTTDQAGSEYGGAEYGGPETWQGPPGANDCYSPSMSPAPQVVPHGRTRLPRPMVSDDLDDMVPMRANPRQDNGRTSVQTDSPSPAPSPHQLLRNADQKIPEKTLELRQNGNAPVIDAARKAMLQEWDDDVAKLTNLLGRQTAQLQSKEDEYAKVEAQCHQAQLRRAAVEEEYNRTQSSITENQQLLQSKHKRLQDIQQQLEQLHMEFSREKEEVERIESSLVVQQESLYEQEIKREKVREESSAVLAVHTSVKEDRDQLQRKIDNMKAELKSLQTLQGLAEEGGL